MTINTRNGGPKENNKLTHDLWSTSNCSLKQLETEKQNCKLQSSDKYATLYMPYTKPK